MQVEIDSLKCVKLLVSRGIETTKAEAAIETLTDIELRNLYSKQEADTMLSAAVEKVFQRVDREMDERNKQFDERNKQFDERMRMLERKNREELQGMDKRAADDLLEARNSRRWQTGIIISTMVVIGVGLAGLIHYIH